MCSVGLSLETRYQIAAAELYSGESQKEIGKRFGVSQAHVSRICDPFGSLKRRKKYLRNYYRDLEKSRKKQSAKLKKYRKAKSRFELALYDSRSNARKPGCVAIAATAKQLEDRFKSQQGLCAICGMPDGPTRSSRLRPDHCHKTGKFRGWLCHRCNTGMHVFEEFPDAVSNYLQRI